MKAKILGIGMILTLCLFAAPGMADTRTVNITLDTWVGSASPTANHDGNVMVSIRNDTYDSWGYYIADLSALNIEAITSANITIIGGGGAHATCSDAGAMSLGAYEVYVPFNVTTLTWNLQPCGTGFDQSDNCNLTKSGTFADATGNTNITCSYFFGHLNYPYTADITELVAREAAGDDIVRFVIFPYYRTGTGALEYAFYPYENGGNAAYLTMAGNFTWVEPATTTTAPGIDDPAYDMSGYLGYTGGTKIIVDAIFTPMVWAFFACLGLSGYLAFKLGHDQAVVFIGVMVFTVTLLTIFGIFPIWIVILEIVIGAFLLGGFLIKSQAGG